MRLSAPWGPTRPRSIRALSRCALAAAAIAAIGGCAEPGVVRVVDGREVEGRFISDAAYALYARAAEVEAFGGDPRAALAALAVAAREDPASPEIWTKIAAIRCRSLETREGEEAIAQAKAADPAYAPLYREEARCRLVEAAHAASPEDRRRREAEALEAARRAIDLDPDDTDATILLSDVLTRVGRPGDARRVLLELTLKKPAEPAGFRALYAFGRAQRDEALVRRAGRKLLELGERVDPDVRALSPLAAIDEALGAGDLPAARRAAHHARIPLAEVAVRAAALGKTSVARAQAETIAGADPGDASARIALAVAADLAGDAAALASALADIPAAEGAITPPSLLARLLFAELLDRRVGPDAARAFLGALPNGQPTGDDLLDRVAARVRKRLGPSP